MKDIGRRLLYFMVLVVTIIGCAKSKGGGYLMPAGIAENGALVHSAVQPNSDVRYWGITVVKNEGKADAILEDAEVVLEQGSVDDLGLLGFVVMRGSENQDCAALSAG